MKSVLILGGSQQQLPAIQTAQRLGMWVVVADKNPNCVGREFADAFYEASTLDKAAVLKVAINECIDGVLVTATDQPNVTAGYVNDHLQLNGLTEQAAQRVTNKYQMVQIGQQAGIPFPKCQLVASAEDFEQAVNSWHSYPAICKPQASSGGRGVIAVNKPEELTQALAYAETAVAETGVVLAEFIDGQEYSAEAFILNGHVELVALTEKLTSGSPHFVELGHFQPSHLTPELSHKLKQILAKIPAAYQLDNIGLHVEFKVHEEQITLIEFGARLGGAMITSHLVPEACGVDLVEIALKLAVNDSIDLALYQAKWQRPTAIKYLVPEVSGNIKTISCPKRLEKQFNQRVFLFKRPGDWVVKKLRSGTQRVGLVIEQGSTRKEALQNAKASAQSFTIEVEEYPEESR